MDPQETQQQAMHMMALMIPIILIGWAIGLAIIIIPFWQIFKKAGMSGALSLLMALPLINIIMVYVLAFSEWKVVPIQAAQAYPPSYPPPPSNFPPATPPSPFTPQS